MLGMMNDQASWLRIIIIIIIIAQFIYHSML